MRGHRPSNLWASVSGRVLRSWKSSAGRPLKIPHRCHSEGAKRLKNLAIVFYWEKKILRAFGPLFSKFFPQQGSFRNGDRRLLLCSFHPKNIILPMWWNRLIKSMADIMPAHKGVLRHFLIPRVEEIKNLFGIYHFETDLRLGMLKKIYFLKTKTYEPETQYAMQQLLKPGMCALDIGANTGFTSLFIAHLVGPSGHVYSFEPVSRNFYLLKRNIEKNSLNYVKPLRLALSDRAGSISIAINPLNDGGNTIGDVKNNPDFNRQEIVKETVATVRLDDFLLENGVRHVDFIKIDVEGAESLVFKGASELLSRQDAPPIICEVGDEAQQQIGISEEELRNLLYGFGYKSYWLAPHFPPLEPATKVKALTNILFRKE